MTPPAPVTVSSVCFRFDDADPRRLDDPDLLEAALRQAVGVAGLTEVACARHRFEPQGVSAVLLLSESHVAVHTWPEHASAYVTLTSCRELGTGTVARLRDGLAQELRAERTATLVGSL